MNLLTYVGLVLLGLFTTLFIASLFVYSGNLFYVTIVGMIVGAVLTGAGSALPKDKQ